MVRPGMGRNRKRRPEKDGDMVASLCVVGNHWPMLSAPYPRLVCVGAQKCATSFLYSVLREHPKVTVARKDIGKVSDEFPVAFEAGLFTRPDGPDLVKSVNPDAKILICVRDPVERAISEYRMRIRNGRETRDFLTALEANEQTGPAAYIRRSRYDLDIPRWRAAFNNVLVLSADNGTRFNLWRLFGFIGLRDFDALLLIARPPMEYAKASSAEGQLATKDLPPELRRLHDAELSAGQKAELRRRYFADPTHL